MLWDMGQKDECNTFLDGLVMLQNSLDEETANLSELFYLWLEHIKELVEDKVYDGPVYDLLSECIEKLN